MHSDLSSVGIQYGRFVDPRGTRTEITPEMLDAIPRLVERGCSLHDVVSVVGLSPSKVTEWESAAEALSSDVSWAEIPVSVQRYMVFVRTFEDAMRNMKTTLFERIMSDGSWSSASWLLQRRFPEEYNVVAGEGFEPLESKAPSAADRALDEIAPAD